ncbi:MAG: hypothetical protein R2795_17265 [Saprospiraceae bacterium]
MAIPWQVAPNRACLCFAMDTQGRKILKEVIPLRLGKQQQPKGLKVWEYRDIQQCLKDYGCNRNAIPAAPLVDDRFFLSCGATVSEASHFVIYTVRLPPGRQLIKPKADSFLRSQLT